MRLFVAIVLDTDARTHVERIQYQLKIRSRNIRLTPFENLHLTLAFLGEVSSERIPEITSIMDAVQCTPFVIQLSQLGCFFKHYGDIWWVGADGKNELLLLQHSLTNALRECRIWFDPKPFVPHLTIARDVVIAHTTQKEELLSRTDAYTMPVDSISLMSSERGDKGPLYSELHRKMLK